MTLDDVREAVARIERAKGDPEAAHSYEDNLWKDVLTFLALEGNELAAEALKTVDIEFPRWCA